MPTSRSQGVPCAPDIGVPHMVLPLIVPVPATPVVPALDLTTETITQATASPVSYTHLTLPTICSV